MTWGWRQPTVLLPATAEGWSAERRDAVLLHELFHVERRDSLANGLAVVLRAVFWPHPGAWYAARRLRREAELAVDRAVVAAGVEPRRYGRHLLAIAGELGGRLPDLAAGAGSALGARIEALLAPTATDPPSRWRPALAALVATVSLAAPGWRLAATPDVPAVPSLTPSAPAADGTRTWTLPCAEGPCDGGTRKAAELLARTGVAGTVAVQRIDDGALVVLTSRRPDDVAADEALVRAPAASLAKLAIAAIWWDSGRGDVERSCPARYRTRAGVVVHNAGARDRGTITVPRDMLVLSCNTAAAVMADELLDALGEEGLRTRLEALGPGALGLGEVDPEQWPALAAGLSDHPVSPLQVSAMLQAIARDGRVSVDPTAGGQLMSAETAARLRAAMDGVISDGTARRVMPQLEWSAWRLGGKTATVSREVDGAEILDGWFAGLAYGPDGVPRFTVVALVQGGGTGGGAAAGIAAEMTRFLARAAGDEL